MTQVKHFYKAENTDCKKKIELDKLYWNLNKRHIDLNNQILTYSTYLLSVCGENGFYLVTNGPFKFM